MNFLPWTDIGQFHSVRKSLKYDVKPKLLYKSKIKLHGTNAGVQVSAEGEVAAQSRSGFISPGKSDNAGFAAFVEANKDAWATKAAKNYVYYGEWCGKGVQKGVAISKIDKKIFAIFAAAPIEQSNALILDPSELAKLLGGVLDIPEVFVLPWMNDDITVDWDGDDTSLTSTTDFINQRVLEVEQLDPWVDQVFGVQGVGEGLVFYPFPYSAEVRHLIFKAKGEEHKTVATAKPAQIDPEKASSAAAFAELVLTPARLGQGLGALPEASIRQTGAFIEWCLGDVQKECQGELETSALSWADAKSAIALKAKSWFFETLKNS